MKMDKLIFIVFSILPTKDLTLASYGVDVSQPISMTHWTCLRNAGYNFAIIRVYRSNGRIDTNASDTIKNARSAGIQDVDGYIFPCFKCGNPRDQIQDAMNNLRQDGAQINKLWLDIENPKYWGLDHESNADFIRQLVNETTQLGITVAIYTSKSQWDPITGGSTEFGQLPLWYAHYNNQANFNDFTPFGGWKAPVMKQFVGDANVCDVDVDKNWYP